MKVWQLATAVAAMALITACSNPEADWNKARADGSETAYQAFLDRHPDGDWANKARAELDIIRDERDWESAQISDAIQSYNSYLLAHPTGVHMGEARQRITELETQAAWESAWAAGTPEAMEEFLIRYGDSPQAEQARRRIAELGQPPKTVQESPPRAAGPASSAAATSQRSTPAKPPVRASGNHQVQVGAFSSADKAERARTDIEKRHYGIVGSLSVEKPSGNDTIYRVKSSRMSEEAARSTCAALKRAGQDCMVVLP